MRTTITLLAALAALTGLPALAEDPAPARPYALDLTAATYGGAFDGFGVRRDSGGLAVVEVRGTPEVRGEGWRIEAPFRVAHRATFGADLSETTGALSVEPWLQASPRLRVGAEAGVLGAERPSWPDPYQRDNATGALAPTDRYGYFAWRAGAQLYARPGAHQHLRAHYRFASYDYRQDPRFDELLEPMHLTPRDRTEHALEGSWRYVEKAWALGLRADYTFRDYATLLARDRRTGSSAGNPTQQLSIWEPAAELELDRLEGRLALSFRYGMQLQSDPFQGYYSSTTHHPRIQVKLEATPRLAVKAALEGWFERYGPDGSTHLEGADTRRVDDRTKLGGEVAYRLGGGLSLRGEVSWLRRTTNYQDLVQLTPSLTTGRTYDIRYDYTNTTVLAGLEYKL
jgi:hypothetical protein